MTRGSEAEKQQLLRQAQKASRDVAQYLKQEDCDPFSKELRDHRGRIKQCYQHIIFEDLQFATEHDVERSLWKYGFYVVIGEYRKAVKHAKDDERKPPPNTRKLEAFLNEAIGFYRHTLALLRTQHDIDLHGIVDFSPTHADAEAPLTDEQKRAIATCHRCLVYLGDIARYGSLLLPQGEAVGEVMAEEARKYYQAALCLIPEDGTPHNQLAVLSAGTLDSPCDAAYRYFRCMATTNPFANARSNIKGLLEKNKAKMATFEKGDPQMEDVDYLLCQFLGIHDVLYRRLSLQSFETRCNTVLQSFEACLAVSAHAMRDIANGNIGPESTPDKPFLTSVQVLQMIVINMFNVGAHVAQKGKQSSKNQQSGTKYFDCAIYLALRMLVKLAEWCAQVVAETAHVSPCPAESYLCSVKICADWLMTPVMTTVLNAKDETPTLLNLWTALGKLLNFLSNRAGDDTALSVANGWVQKTALPEDVELRGFKPLKTAHVSMDFRLANRCRTKSEESDLRVQTLLFAGRFFADSKKYDFSFDQTGQTFCLRNKSGGMSVPRVRNYGLSNKTRQAWESAPTAGSVQRERAGHLMAQARLQSEIARLETVMATSVPAGPAPFLVPDIQCFASNLRLLKELILSQQFVVIVPMVVIGALDSLKKGSERINVGAREATRYLSKALKEGYFGIRAQKPHEILTEQRPASDSLHVLACCRYYAHHVASRPDLVTLLTADPSLGDWAKREGISVESLTEFLRRFKSRRGR